MFKRSFFAKKPRFEYESLGNLPMEPERIPIPERVTLLVKSTSGGEGALSLKKGDRVKTGQKLNLCPGCEDYAISSVTGTIASISPYIGDFGQSYTAVTIDAEPEDEFDDTFATLLGDGVEAAKDYLAGVPGASSLDQFSDPEKHIDTVVICGVEKDLFMTTNQYVMKTRIGFMEKGISALKKMSGAHKAVIALPEELINDAGRIGGASGVELRPIDTSYPSSLPKMMMKDVVGKPVAAGQSCEDMGICFVSAEAVASIGQAVMEERIPVTKVFTFINKDLSRTLVEARVGTPLADIFNAFDVSLFDKDRIISGGPMTGAAVYSVDYPICTGTDAVMVQDGEDVPMVSDTACINCGECVRICPAKVPVNMLIRFLEVREYEDAAELYDLDSCVECGLCSFVCVSKIPIFQYIKLAKYELGRIRSEEEASDV